MQQKSQQVITTTQIRLSEDVYSYIKSESDRLGISMNALMVMLIDYGRKLHNATITLDPQPTDYQKARS